MAHATPLILVLLGALAVADDGPHSISLGFVVAGAALESVSLFDFPMHATFGPDGVVRWCALRRQMIPWSRISDIRRAPGPRFRRVDVQYASPGAMPVAGIRGAGAYARARPEAIRGGLVKGRRSAGQSLGPGGSGDRSLHARRGPYGRTRPAPGGLVAACGRRRYLLVDRSEGAEEFDAVVDGLVAWAPGLAVHAARPPAGWPPTWLYRRGARAAE